MEKKSMDIKTTRNALTWLWKAKKRISKEIYGMSSEELKAYFDKVPDIHPNVKTIDLDERYARSTSH